MFSTKPDQLGTGSGKSNLYRVLKSLHYISIRFSIKLSHAGLEAVDIPNALARSVQRRKNDAK
jgi:hypothetical protein